MVMRSQKFQVVCHTLTEVPSPLYHFLRAINDADAELEILGK